MISELEANAHPRRWRLRALLTAALALSTLGASGCKNRNKGGTISELTPPKDAEPWEASLASIFDDSYTPTAVHMQGRAPNDVLDQRLFLSRLGHANIVMLVRVEQVWGKGRYQGRQDQFLEIEQREELLGNLPKDAPERLLIEVESTDELPGELKDEIMLLFLHWDVESEPPFHHHLMPADEELVTLIHAMVKHAQKEGVLNAKGDETSEKQRKRRRGRKGKRDKKGEASAGPSEPVDDSRPGAGTPITGGGAPPPGGGLAPDEPPPPSGPRPDASTGLQDLGADPEPEPAPEGAE